MLMEGPFQSDFFKGQDVSLPGSNKFIFGFVIA
jgi:hypothetical protein